MADNVPDIPTALVEALRAARHVAALTGSGISAESGVPTFRDPQDGIWAKYRPEELATPQAFRRDPKLVWDWYTWRRRLVAQAMPNPAHLALVELERRVPRLTLITQNVDGLHQRAGNQAVIELHGNVNRSKCFREGMVVEAWEETGQSPPACPHCGGPLRPDVVWFGETLPRDALQAAVVAAGSCQIFFSIGTSGLIEPAASLAYAALRRGALVVEINPAATPLSDDAIPLRGPAGRVLPALMQAAWPPEPGMEKGE
jgi:NAD-dependent deacetylase